jgi:diguanylate cyclase (GGDEF)-like protein
VELLLAVRFIALVLLGILMLGSAPAEAASAWQNLADPVFVRADGRELPEAAAMAVAQDRAGFLWVGTQGGLGRFDGYHFRNFFADAGNPDALPDGYVRTLLGGTEGGVWIGSSSSGLVHFDAATETFHTWRPDRSGRRGPRSASVDAIVPAGPGALWVGGDGGLDRFDAHAGTFTPVTLATRGPQPVVWSLLVDRAGTVWAGTQDGLFARAAGATQFHEYPLHSAGISKPAIYSIAEDHAGRLWAGSVNVLFVLDAAHRPVRQVRSIQQSQASLAPGQQWSLIEMTPGVMWAGTDAAISIVDTATLRVHRVVADAGYGGGLSSGRALQFLRDRSGLVWVANHVGGLLLFNPFSTGLYEISTTRAEIGFTEKGAVALAALPGNRLWVGGFAGRLAEFAAHPAPTLLADVPNHAAVQALLVDRDGTLWLGTTGGLCRLRPGSRQAECPAHPTKLTGASIYALEENGPRLWVGGSAGLFTEDLANGAIAPFPPGGREGFANSQVRVLFYDRKDRLWVGTENGLDRVDPSGAIERFTFAPGNSDSIGPGGMATLLEDRRGRIWAGASGGPLDVITEDARGHEHFRHIGIANGMPHENVDGIAEDARGRMWASTDRGIALIDPDTLEARAFGLADGVSDGAYWAGTVSQTEDGTIFFGGLDGITVIAPDAASPWTYAPPVVVSALHVGRRNIPAAAINRGDATIDLPANARDINVEFSALDFSAPQSLRYSYKLDGYDRDWIDADTQHRDATYTHLSPGDYTLEVRASNRVGLWSRHVLRIGVRAQPAWYETWWFRLLLGLVCVLAAYAAHRMRTGVLRRRQSELEGLVSERTHALSDANVKLQELSLSDPLTGLRNRRFLAQHIDADVAVALRRYDDWRTAATGAEPPSEADLLFFLIDLDHLKAINDQYGHHSGDTVLIQMRDRLLEVFRESDFIVRWGGDEFLTVARGSKRIEAAAIAERICQAVGRRPFELGGGQELQCSVSVGFAAYPFVPAAPSGLGWPDIVGIADQALYKAKQSGRNNWFGLIAGRNADPAYLAQQLESDADEAVSSGALRVVTREGTPVR